MRRKFTKYPSSTVKASTRDYSEYYGIVAVPSHIKNSEIVDHLIKCVESGELNEYDEWGAVNFLSGYFRTTDINLRDVCDAITEVWYNRPDIKNFDKLVRLGV